MSTLKLDGNTVVLGLLGHPIAQVKACMPLTELLQSRGRNAVLVPMHVSPADLPAVIDALAKLHNVAGFVVTVPHKQAVFAALEDLLPMAKAAGAVNVVRKREGRWQGELLDGIGFVDNLRAHGVDPAGLEVAIAGAGGAGHAIAFALAEAGAAVLRIHDADAARQQSLVHRLQSHGHRAHGVAEIKASQLLVNATPAGMAPGDPLPIPLTAIEAGCVVADVIMSPAITPLLELAAQRGARTVTGRGMMEWQLQRMTDFFGEVIPP